MDRPRVHHSSGTVTGPPTVIEIDEKASGHVGDVEKHSNLSAIGAGPSLPAATAVVSSPPK